MASSSTKHHYLLLLSLFIFNNLIIGNEISQSLVEPECDVGEEINLAKPDISWLNEKWIENVDILHQIENALCSGRVVQIRNALNHQVAEELVRELDNSSQWAEFSSSTDSFLPLPQSIFQPLHHDNNDFVCERVQENIVQYKNNLKESPGYYYPSDSTAPMYFKSGIYQHKMNAIHNQTQHPPTMAKLKELFSSNTMMYLFSKLSRSRLTKHNLNPTWYKVGDHITIHNDVVKNRRLSYILHLGMKHPKRSTGPSIDMTEWNIKDGGNLVWCDPVEVIVPTFNSLTIFAVSSRSYHFVEPVWQSSSSSSVLNNPSNDGSNDHGGIDSHLLLDEHRKRYAVSGFYFANDKDVSDWNSFAKSLPYPSQHALLIEQ